MTSQTVIIVNNAVGNSFEMVSKESNYADNELVVFVQIYVLRKSIVVTKQPSFLHYGILF